MTKLTRKYHRIFANTGPTGIVGQFGSFKGGTAAYSDDPDVIQALDAYRDGWQYAGLTNNTPSIEDFNGLMNLFSRQQVYTHQSGVAEWNSATTYFINSIVSDGLGNIYASLADDNLDNALTDFTKWFYMHGRSYTGIGTGYTATNADHIINWNATGCPTGPSASELNRIILPGTTSNLKGREYIIIAGHENIGTTGYSDLYVSAPENRPWVPRQMKSKEIVKYTCDGNYWNIKIY